MKKHANFVFTNWIILVPLVLGALFLGYAANKSGDKLIARDNKILRANYSVIQSNYFVTYKNLEFKRLPSPQDYFLELVDEVKQLPEGLSWTDLLDFINFKYDKDKELFERDWQLEGDLLKLSYFMNFVHSMWAFGKPEDQFGKFKNTGVRAWKKTKYKDEFNKIFLTDYLESPVGECNDYASVLYMLARMADFDANHVGSPDHIYLEVKIGGQPYIFDATYNFFTQNSNQGFLNQDFAKRYELFVFHSENEKPNNKKRYRKRFGSLRSMHLLTRGRLDRRKPKVYDNWNHFKRFLADGFLPASGY